MKHDTLKEKGNLRRIRYLEDPEQVKEILDLIRKYDLTVLTCGPYGGEFSSYEAAIKSDKYNSLDNCFIINEKESKLELTTKYYEYPHNTTYVFSLKGEDDVNLITGQRAYCLFNKFFKIPEIKEGILDLDQDTEKYIQSARPILGFNPKFNKQYLKDVYEYDKNSAYSSIQLDKIPDLDNMIDAKGLLIVKENQVGFLRDDFLSMVGPGSPADYIFNLIPTPEKLKEYIKKYYDLKSTLQGQKKKDAKDYLNLPIGYAQRKNPFFRAYIVHSCNKLIEEAIDENTLCWNTDAIFSKVKRPDLEIGSEVGQWKEEKIKKFCYIDHVYQKDDEIPTYRGKPKQFFRAFEKKYGHKFDLLKDNISSVTRENVWIFDLKKLKLVRNDYEKI